MHDSVTQATQRGTDRTGRPYAGSATPGLCARRYWRSMNPGLPPPEPLTCLARGPDCCVNSAVADVRRVA